jgi:hypothetical protein
MRRDAELAAQRAELRRRIADERAALRREVQPVAQALDVRSRINDVLKHFKQFAMRNPLAVAGTAAALVIFKPRMLLRVAQQGLMLWRTWRSVRSVVPPSVLSRLTGFLR